MMTSDLYCEHMHGIVSSSRSNTVASFGIFFFSLIGDDMKKILSDFITDMDLLAYLFCQ
jgi:hypothetical protein